MTSLDEEIGIRTYSTNYTGCGGAIKRNAADFMVDEVITDKAKSSITGKNGYAVYRLSKTGYDTSHALKKVHARLKPLGLKDSRATTTQYVCATSKNARNQERQEGNVSLRLLGYTQRPLSARDMVGNAFGITVHEHNGTLGEFTEWDKILNFYAYQRFGSTRPMTHLVGRAMVMGQWDRAADIILRYESPHDTGEWAQIRKDVCACKTYREMVDTMPRSMDIERKLAYELDGNPDAREAITMLPVQMRRFYVQAYQSHIFNRALSAACEAGDSLVAQDGDVCYDKAGKVGRYGGQSGQMLAMPLVGHSYYAKTRFARHISDVMKEDDMSPKRFSVKGMGEVSAQGGFRTISIRATDAKIEGDTVHVTLGRGSYATALMREIIKPADPVTAGLAA